MPLAFHEVLQATGAELSTGDAGALVHGLSTDSRTLQPGELFLALSGPNFDGNRFAGEALARGAAGLLLERRETSAPLDAGECPVARIDDGRRALADLARWHRRRLAIPVIGVTGSCGKTTTKNVLVTLLGGLRRVVGSPASFNNEIGVPRTLLMADEETELLVVEMGTNAPGEIAALCSIAAPTAGIVTNVGASHLSGLRSVEGVAREKGALPAAVPDEGFVVLNADCRHAPDMRRRTRACVITFSIEGEGDLDASGIWFHGGGTTFTLGGSRAQGGCEVTLPLLGQHMVQNVLAALAACVGLGFELEQVLPALGQLESGRGRMQRRDVAGITLFDDSYNANPESAKASVRVLAGLHGWRRRVLVMGDMLELAEASEGLHRDLGRQVARAGIDLFVAVGPEARAAAEGARSAGCASDGVVHFASLKAALAEVPALLRAGDLVLVKGSRAARLDRLVSTLADGGEDEVQERPVQTGTSGSGGGWFRSS